MTDVEQATVRDIRISEVFGPTFQGEGPLTGRRCGFVRLAGCNLDCTRCDTPFTWDWQGRTGTAYDPNVEIRRTNTRTVARHIGEMGVDLAVVTGGEPLIQAWALRTLTRDLNTIGVRVQVETNGTRPPLRHLDEDPLDITYVVSPKTRAMATSRHAIFPDLLAEFVDLDAAFKFVAATPADLDEIASIAVDADIPPGQIWVMPEGVTPEAVMTTAKDLADLVLGAGWNLTLRQHVLLWGDERGR